MRARLRMNKRLTIFLGLALLTANAVVGSSAAAATRVERARAFVPHELIVKLDGERSAHTHGLPAGVGVREAAASLRRNPAVAYAAPNYIATASAIEPAPIPNDPGTLTGLPGVPGGWVTKQWNLLPWEGPGTPVLPTAPGGIDAIGAWENLDAVKRPGARGITIAVLDTGIAYRALGSRFRRSPDFTAGQFVKGYDFIDNTNTALDRNGHGTHVAGTIAEKTNNGIGLTGLAYRAKLMPVRVLDRLGRGRADDIAAGVRFATDHKADVINMSFNFGCGKKVPSVAQAIHYATHRGVIVVASVGNLGSESCVSPPATIPGVIGVGGTTEGGCIGNYSLAGDDVDVVAPGGGEPEATCASVLMDPIFQVTFNAGNERRFGEPSDYVGTSMAAAHVSGVAALVLASGLIDRTKKGGSIQAQVATRLKQTARSLGLSPLLEGAGLIDAARATDPECQLACFSNRH
jgi:serine protease